MFERKSSKAEVAPETPAKASEKPPTIERKPVPTPTEVSEAIAMIGAKVKVTGDIESSEDLLIEGEVNGTVKLVDNELVIGNSGRVQANIEAKTIRIEGEVQGDIVGQERVVITTTGNVQGNVSSPRVMLEDGGRFKGSIDMGGPAKGTAAGQQRPTASTPAQQQPKSADQAAASKAG
ncbi:MAG: polymer-forming cytoskeletal protein [Chromatocurvus sp.]